MGVVVLALGCRDERGAPAPAPSPSPELVPFGERFGEARIVNLHASPSSPPQPLDVWVHRDADGNVERLPDPVAFGDVTPWFYGADAYLVPAGERDPAKAVRSMLFVTRGQRRTFVALGLAASTGGNFADVGSSGVVAPKPAPGRAAVFLYGKALEAFGAELERHHGDQVFRVGDGRGACRATSDPNSPDLEPILLGMDAEIVLDLAPGASVISLHGRGGGGCGDPPALAFEVTLAAGEAAWSFVFTRDGERLEAITLPVGR